MLCSTTYYMDSVLSHAHIHTHIHNTHTHTHNTHTNTHTHKNKHTQHIYVHTHTQHTHIQGLILLLATAKCTDVWRTYVRTICIQLVHALLFLHTYCSLLCSFIPLSAGVSLGCLWLGHHAFLPGLLIVPVLWTLVSGPTRSGTSGLTRSMQSTGQVKPIHMHGIHACTHTHIHTCTHMQVYTCILNPHYIHRQPIL